MDSTTSYDYNTSDKELKNPYVIENIFLFAGAIIQIIAGIALVYLARGFVLEEKDKLAVMVLLFALAILGVEVKLLIRVFSQIRFFFGRSYPKNLCDLNSAGTTEIINSLKTQSIAFVEPDGPLSGVIYNWVKPLVTCPPPLQVAAIQYFHSLFGMSAILISMLVSWFLFSGQPHEGIISWSYLPLTGLSITQTRSPPDIMPSAFSPPFRLSNTITSNVSRVLPFWRVFCVSKRTENRPSKQSCSN